MTLSILLFHFWFNLWITFVTIASLVLKWLLFEKANSDELIPMAFNFRIAYFSQPPVAMPIFILGFAIKNLTKLEAPSISRNSFSFALNSDSICEINSDIIFSYSIVFGILFSCFKTSYSVIPQSVTLVNSDQF